MVNGRQGRAMVVVTMLLLFARVLFAADISVRTDRNPAGLSESFQIIFEAEGGVDDEPDFSPLERDFQVISTSQSSRLSIINGKSSSTKTWTLTVLARRTGRLEIPAIAFGSERSPAGNVEITLAATAPGRRPAESNEVFLEVEAQPLQPYVQQQIIYKVRLFRAFPTANASLSEPQAEQGDAIIERIGEDALYDTRVNGRPYQVVERRYAIFPQSSGMLKIGPLTFRGHAGGNAFSMIDPFARRPETLVRQSAPVELEIQSKPDGHDGQLWLPARSLTLTESWSGNPPEFRVGEPITRTLTLIADGLTASQLPELPPWVPQAFKSYPDQPALSDGKSADGMVGTRVEKVAIIPSTPGEFQLPEIRIPWWNTARDQLEFAQLAAQRIVVLPAAATDGAAPTPASPGAGADQAAAQTAAPPELETPPAGGPAASGPNSWQWVSAALALLWVATVLAWRKSRRRAPAQIDLRAQRLGQVCRELERACGRNDAAAAKESLLRWGQIRWPRDTPRSIGEIAGRSGADLAACLRQLDAHLYGRGGRDWSGASLWQAFVAEGKAGQLQPEDGGSELEPLNRI